MICIFEIYFRYCLLTKSEDSAGAHFRIEPTCIIITLTILKYVDDLCDIISNGDTNLVRTIEVNQNLNEAVNCYKNELEVKRQFLDQSNDQGYYYDEAMYYSENENLDKKDKVGDLGKEGCN